MSSMIRPRGRLAPRVYWARRLMVLALAFGLVFGIAHLLAGGSDGKSGRGDTAAPVDADALSTTTTTTATTQEPTNPPTRKKSRRAPTTPPLAQPDGPCSDDEVVMTPVLASPVAGGEVTFGLEISSIDSAACTFRVSPSTVVVKLVSGDDFIWSSQECPRSLPTVDVVARSSVPAKVNVSWSGRRSAKTCLSSAEWARAGWYHAIAAALGGEPTDVQFRLALPTSQTITKTASPTQQPTDRVTDRATDRVTDSATDSGTDQPTGKPTGAPGPTRSPSGATLPTR